MSNGNKRILGVLAVVVLAGAGWAVMRKSPETPTSTTAAVPTVDELADEPDLAADRSAPQGGAGAGRLQAPQGEQAADETAQQLPQRKERKTEVRRRRPTKRQQSEELVIEEPTGGKKKKFFGK